MTFWNDIDAQLDRIEAEKPDTFDGVRAILLDSEYGDVAADRNLNGYRAFPNNSAFFAGGGGDRSLRGSLLRAGWVITWADAYYFYVASHTVTGEVLTYIEGDVLRGDAR